MENRTLRAYLKVLDLYMDNHEVYGYLIKNVNANSPDSVTMTCVETDPNGRENEPYMLTIRLDGDRMPHILNEDGDDCLYDYLDESGFTKEDADHETHAYATLVYN